MTNPRHAAWALLLLATIARADLEAGLEAVLRRDYETALREFKPLAAEGDVAAQVNLGNLFMKGWGVKQNYVEAARWYRNAAEQNERMAQSKLGILYYHGLGVPQDSTEAAHWFEKAARQGEPSAQAILGTLYAQGEGVNPDLAQAYYWYTLAMEQGSEEAKRGRDSLADEMTPGQMDEALKRLAETRRELAKLDKADDLTEPAGEGKALPRPQTRAAGASGAGKSGAKAKTHRKNAGKRPARKARTGIKR